ncbi:MAG TPA: glycosyltransferase family 2 protein [Candidatus Bathyarchaeia archaeon]|nr:glycosyltransferase family 2 protein [Candidatus Bathyarchaeia archaeon]
MLQLQSKAGSHPSDTSYKIVVVLPAYNEAGTIAHTILEANNHFSKIHPNIEYVVAEDGSTDGTPQVLSHLQGIMPCLQVNSSPKRKGYPTAVRDGILSVGKDADRILFMDSDGQYDPRDFQKLLRLADNADIVIGRRTSRTESPLRVFLSTGVRLLERQMFGLKCRDITSAFRLMRRDVAQTLASRIHYSKYNFWTEFTALAAVSHYKIVEVPVSYRKRQSGGSRVYSSRKLARVVLSELNALTRIWIRSVTTPPAQLRQV